MHVIATREVTHSIAAAGACWQALFSRLEKADWSSLHGLFFCVYIYMKIHQVGWVKATQDRQRQAFRNHV